MLLLLLLLPDKRDKTPFSVFDSLKKISTTIAKKEKKRNTRCLCRQSMYISITVLENVQGNIYINIYIYNVQPLGAL